MAENTRIKVKTTKANKLNKKTNGKLKRNTYISNHTQVVTLFKMILQFCGLNLLWGVILLNKKEK